MVMNVGGAWGRPADIADLNSNNGCHAILPSNICSESKYRDHGQLQRGLLSFRSSPLSCCNSTRELAHIDPSPEQEEDRDVIREDRIIYNCESNVESWDLVEPSNLHCQECVVSGYSVYTRSNFKANGISFEDGISASEQMLFPEGKALKDFLPDGQNGGLEKKGCTDSYERGEHGGGRERMMCVHASKALRVRSSGGKDRHSKVKTARGPRDRRVRLSVPTALQFYDIQDRLGYDQPSKALDWLLGKAKCAIDGLPTPSGISNMSCISCNTIPEISTSAMIGTEVGISTARAADMLISVPEFSAHDNATDFISSSSQQHCNTMVDARRSRARARERARERAKEKGKASGSNHGIQTQSTQITFPFVSPSGSQGTDNYSKSKSSTYLQHGNSSNHEQQISLFNHYGQASPGPRFDSTSNPERLLYYSPHIAVPGMISRPSNANNSINILGPPSAQLHLEDQALGMKKTRDIGTPPPFSVINLPYNHPRNADDHDSGEDNNNNNLSEKCSTIPEFINASASSPEDIVGNVCYIDQPALMSSLLMNRGTLQSMISRPADIIASTASATYDEVQLVPNNTAWNALQRNFSPRIQQRILQGFCFDQEQYDDYAATPREQNP